MKHETPALLHAPAARQKVDAMKKFETRKEELKEAAGEAAEASVEADHDAETAERLAAEVTSPGLPS